MKMNQFQSGMILIKSPGIFWKLERVDIFIIPYHPESATTLLGVYTRIAGGTFLTEEVGVNIPVFLAYFEETHFNGGGHYQAIEPVRSSAMLEDVKTRFGHDVAQTMSLPDQGLEWLPSIDL